MGIAVVAHTAATFAVGFLAGRRWRRRGAAEDVDDASSGARRGLSTLRQPGRTVAIVTTAALPWRTGTSVNPLLRAAHLEHDAGCKVILVVPWLEEEEQKLIFPAGTTFKSRELHAEFIVQEARKRTQLPCNFRVMFYDGKYFSGMGSILPVGDVTAAVPTEDADVAILEEPEHLNWCQHKSRWTDRFKHVVGIMHTNYLAYLEDGPGFTAGNVAALKRVNKWVCRIHCHKVIKLSDAVQKLPRQVTCNVHGVGGNFIAIGRKVRDTVPEDGGRRFTKGAYFIGKAVWGKGYHELLDLMAAHSKLTKRRRDDERRERRAARDAAVQQSLDEASADGALDGPEAAALHSAAADAAAAASGSHLQKGSSSAPNNSGGAGGGECHLDIFGSGEDLEAIKADATSKNLDVSFYGGRDHADESMHAYQVFVNPSTSDVVATTTAEALAMGKWVVVQDIPCNEFFKQFPNCLTYDDAAGFSGALLHALEHEPAVMGDELLHKLSWEAATDRLLDVSAIKPEEWPGPRERRYDAMLWRMYRSVTGLSVLRAALGFSSATGEDEPLGETEEEEDRHADWELWHDLFQIQPTR